jgi:hypothetical protein
MCVAVTETNGRVDVCGCTLALGNTFTLQMPASSNGVGTLDIPASGDSSESEDSTNPHYALPAMARYASYDGVNRLR